MGTSRSRGAGYVTIKRSTYIERMVSILEKLASNVVIKNRRLSGAAARTGNLDKKGSSNIWRKGVNVERRNETKLIDERTSVICV